MRFSIFLVVVFSLTASVAFAAPKKSADQAVNALKSALEKSDDTDEKKDVVPAPVKTHEKKIHEAVMPTWIEIPVASRQKIVDAWQRLPEATRPPFPVYRDMMLEKQCKTSSKALAPLGKGGTQKKSVIAK